MALPKCKVCYRRTSEVGRLGGGWCRSCRELSKLIHRIVGRVTRAEARADAAREERIRVYTVRAEAGENVT